MKKLGILLLLLSVSVFSYGCKKPEGTTDGTVPATDTTAPMTDATTPADPAAPTEPAAPTTP